MNSDNLRAEILNEHNKYRELHSTAPLKYSKELEQSAQTWADTLSNWKILTYSPPNQNYSENIAEVRNSKFLKGAQIAESWYLQETHFDYKDFNHSGPIDQFCLLIWKSSKRMGIGLTQSDDERIYIVVHYSPPGFFNEGLKENVNPPKHYESLSAKKSKSQKIVQATKLNCKVINKHEIEDFRRETLSKINSFRTQHGVPPLILNEEFCKEATIRAKHCAANNTLISRVGETFGETFLELTKQDFIVTGGLAPRHWYAESIGYDYTIEPKTDQYNNFTQLVWKDSKEFGIGIAGSLTGVIYIIGHFLPRGNKTKQYSENVFPPIGKNPYCPCGCGYIAPACIQDLTTTIISKLPTQTSNESHLTFERNTNRTYTTLSGKEDEALGVQNSQIGKKDTSIIPSKKESQTASKFSRKTQELGNEDEGLKNSQIGKKDTSIIPSKKESQTASKFSQKTQELGNEDEGLKNSQIGKNDISNIPSKKETRTASKISQKTSEQGKVNETSGLQNSQIGKKDTSTVPSKKETQTVSKMSVKTLDALGTNQTQNNKRQSREYIMTQSKASAATTKRVLRSLNEFNLDAKNIREEMLQSHNKCREIHFASALEYSADLEASAQAWAETLATALVLTYSPKSLAYSENCAEVRNPFEFKGEEITEMWYAQEKNYDYQNLNHTGPVDQFSVMVWNDSRKVGFGIAVSNDNRIFVVAHYSPPGLIENFKENVKPSKLYKKPTSETLPVIPKDATCSSYKGIKKEELSEFQMDALGKLNHFRIRHNAPPLKLSDKLCKASLDQAKRCATNQMLLPADHNRHGETYLELTIKSFTITGGLAPRHWYAESVGYEFDKEPLSDQYHNFTQMIWKGSTEMGIGVAASLTGVLYVIGSYSPPGNVSDQYLENVLPPSSETKFCSCGCGYLAPTCIQDLKTTIIAKLPSTLVTEKSKASKHGTSVRSYSILENLDKKGTRKSCEMSLKNECGTKMSGQIPVISVQNTKSKESRPCSQVATCKDISQIMQPRDTQKTLSNAPSRSVIDNIKSKESQNISQAASCKEASQSLQQRNTQKTLSNVPAGSVIENIKSKESQNISQASKLKETSQSIQQRDTQKTLSNAPAGSVIDNIKSKVSQNTLQPSASRETAQSLQQRNTQKTLSNITNKTALTNPKPSESQNISKPVSAKEASQILQPRDTQKTLSKMTLENKTSNTSKNIVPIPSNREPSQSKLNENSNKTITNVPAGTALENAKITSQYSVTKVVVLNQEQRENEFEYQTNKSNEINNNF